MSIALKPGFRSLNTLKLVVNFKPQRTAAASRGFLASTRLSCNNSFTVAFRDELQKS